MTSTEVVKPAAPAPPIVIFRHWLNDRRDELKNALPPDISPERFIRAVVTAAQINPDLMACSRQTLWLACMRACRDGLLPDGVEGAIVPYKSTATWIPMYQGLLKRFRKSGQFKWIAAGLVREGESFEHFIDENGEHFRHAPGAKFDAPIQWVYALATTRDGGVFVTVMPIAEANKIRAMSKAARDDAPWKLWPEEMYKKTALRRLAKVLPSVRDREADDADDFDAYEAPAIVAPLAPAAEQRRPSGAAAALDQFAGTPNAGEAGEPDEAAP